jgi:hypothetical protein
VKAHRLARRVVKKLSDAEHRALDELRFGSPGAARRGELKTVLRWRRTQEETIAYAQTLIEAGLIPSAVAARLDVDRYYLAGLLGSREATADSPPRKPCADAPSDATKLQTPIGASSRGCLPAPAAGFRSFAELDAWLEEHVA